MVLNYGYVCLLHLEQIHAHVLLIILVTYNTVRHIPVKNTKLFCLEISHFPGFVEQPYFMLIYRNTEPDWLPFQETNQWYYLIQKRSSGRTCPLLVALQISSCFRLYFHLCRKLFYVKYHTGAGLSSQ